VLAKHDVCDWHMLLHRIIVCITVSNRPNAPASHAWQSCRGDAGEMVAWLAGGSRSEWTDPVSGEVVPSYTMFTQNCDDVLLLNLRH
jgi:hypothetical protein